MMNPIRDGKFTSSNIWALMTKDRKGDGFGAPALKLIKQKQYERKLKRTLDSDLNSKPVNWGKLIEKRVQAMLPFDMNYQSLETVVHPTIPNWAGTPDYLGPDTVGDIKCPWTLQSFCDMYEAMLIGAAELKDVKPEYYWQLVSNSVLTGKAKAELTIYVPYQTELEDIRELARSQDEDLERYTFINFALDDDLPYLNPAGEYKNILTMTFTVPPEDQLALAVAVEKANAIL